jgi:hypothetical protein
MRLPPVPAANVVGRERPDKVAERQRRHNAGPRSRAMPTKISHYQYVARIGKKNRLASMEV